jgi:hypothetical protein
VNCIVVVVAEAFVVKRKASGPDSKVDPMDSGGEIGERCLLLNMGMGSPLPKISNSDTVSSRTNQGPGQFREFPKPTHAK